MDYLMTRLPQSPRHRTADHSAPTRQQDPQAAHGWRALLLHALGSGSAASLASTALVSLRSRQRAGTLPAGTNAASQWVWGEPARRANGWSLRHTLLGFAIHHASSVMWAAGYEAWGRKRPSDPALLRGAGMAALAYVVDYHVVPRRLSPGFENRIGATGVAATYAAFAVGLALVDMLKAGTHRSPPLRAKRRTVFAQPGQNAQQQGRRQQGQP